MAHDPDPLRALGKRLDDLGARQAEKQRGPRQSGIAGRLATELVAGLVVGGGMGWAFDHFFHTTPWGLIVFFMLGAGAAIRGVIRTAQKFNADMMSAPDVEEK